MMFPKPVKREKQRKPMARSRMKGSDAEKRQADKEWADAVKERDDWTCQKPGCGKKDFDNHAHHIAPRSQRPDLKYELSNGKTLCFEHHDWVHANPIEAARLGLLSTEKYESRVSDTVGED